MVNPAASAISAAFGCEKQVSSDEEDEDCDDCDEEENTQCLVSANEHEEDKNDYAGRDPSFEPDYILSDSE